MGEPCDPPGYCATSEAAGGAPSRAAFPRGPSGGRGHARPLAKGGRRARLKRRSPHQAATATASGREDLAGALFVSPHSSPLSLVSVRLAAGGKRAGLGRPGAGASRSGGRV